MRKEQKTQVGTYDACTAEGSFVPLAKMDLDQIQAMMKVALADYESIQLWAKQASKTGNQWNAIFKLAYDVLHTLSEVILQFDKMKARTHECVYAYVCQKHPELLFDWTFLEQLRTLRNRSHYYGKLLMYEDWKGVEFQLNLYINVLKKTIEQKIKNY